MRRFLDSLETFAIDVILERRYGKRAILLRWILLGLSQVYAQIVALRLKLFHARIKRPGVLGCPVISVGNLTVGGTGKTPVVEMLARELQNGGRQVAILSRGYKSVPKPILTRLSDKLFRDKSVFAPRIVSDGSVLLLDSRTAGDEPFMLANNLRGVRVLVDRDRVKSGAFAIDKLGADALILDDGLQYLRLQHSFEVVLIDRQAPFGNRYLLPRGTLREPPKNLRRATHILITKCDEKTSNEELIEEIRRYNRTAKIVECAHRPLHLKNFVSGEIQPLEFLNKLQIGSICGIAVPESFEGALKQLGADIQLSSIFTDHHRYSEREVLSFIRGCSRRDLQAVLTTEKDAVRFPRIIKPEIPIYYMRVQIEILRGHDAWQDLIERIIHPNAITQPQKIYH
ncbi:MAG: tetraacyldisaccharide 4'-kinase [Chthoniobacterales bacterium]